MMRDGAKRRKTTCYLLEIPQDTLTHTFSFLDTRAHIRLARSSKECHAASGLPSSKRFQEDWMRPGAWTKTLRIHKWMTADFLRSIPSTRITGMLFIKGGPTDDQSKLQLAAMARNKQIFDGDLDLQWLNPRATRSFLRKAARLRGVTGLVLDRCEGANAAGLEIVSRLPDLNKLSIADCEEVDAAGLEHISKMQSLVVLKLRHCINVDAAGLEHVSKMQGLRILDMMSCYHVNDAAVQHIARMENLTRLDVSFCSGAGAADLLRASQPINDTR